MPADTFDRRSAAGAADWRFEQLLQGAGLDLRAGDAVHLAVALQSSCSHLASFDGRRPRP